MTPQQFIRTVCHDMRASLLALKELPEWLEEELDLVLDNKPDELVDVMSMIKTHSSRLDAMVNGLSHLVKIRRSALRPSVSVAEVFESVQDKPNLTCQSDVETIPMEPNHAHEVVRHLLDNAYKHGEGKSKTVMLCVFSDEETITISVCDEGPGIKEVHRAG